MKSQQKFITEIKKKYFNSEQILYVAAHLYMKGEHVPKFFSNKTPLNISMNSTEIVIIILSESN